MDSVDLKWHQAFIFIIVVYIGMLFINWKHITSVFHKKAGNTNCRSIDQPRYYNKLFGQFRSIWVNFLWNTVVTCFRLTYKLPKWIIMLKIKIWGQLRSRSCRGQSIDFHCEFPSFIRNTVAMCFHLILKNKHFRYRSQAEVSHLAI